MSLVGKELLGPLSAEEAEELQLSGAPSSSGCDCWWFLRPPFPDIEVIQWRCKLREDDGTPKLDEFGMELYGEREWYTLDNRRLYCLQRAAVSLHPAEARCLVAVTQHDEVNCRESRKFRTSNRGRSVGIGHRDAPDLPRWSWRREVGIAEEVLSAGSALSRQPRRRGPPSGRRTGAAGTARSSCDDEDEPQRGKWDIALNILIFVLVYASLRLALYLGWRLLGRT